VFNVRHYLTHDQKDVYLEWLKKVRDSLAKGQIIRRVNRLAEGNFGDHKFCRDGVVVLLLCGGDKGTQNADIERAVGYWKDWQQRIEP